MKTNKQAVKSTFLRWACLCLGLLVLSNCQKDEFSEDYDIQWPLPEITSFTPGNAMIGSQIMISGTNLDFTKEVRVGAEGVMATVDSATFDMVMVTLPRVFTSGPITLTTSFRRTTITTENFTPEYPAMEVTSWPSEIERTQNIVLTGTNMDMLQEIEVSGMRLEVNPNNVTEDKAIIPTTDMDLPDEVTITITQAYGEIQNATSPTIPVVDFDPNANFTAIEPIILFDFEDGNDPYTSFNDGNITDQSGINTASIVRGRSQNYFTLTAEVNSGSNWNSMGEIAYGQDINLQEFNDPHLTFMLNTNGQLGYFQVELQQNGEDRGGHFVPAVSNNSEDNYTFPVTNGWEWRSVRLADLNGSNGGWGEAIDPSGIISLTLGFKQGNGGNTTTIYEVNLDQIMITDGPSFPGVVIFDFEGGAPTFEANSGADEQGLNVGGVASFSGDNYYSVKKAGIGTWDWTGAIARYEAVDLGNFRNPYINFWINTNATQAFMQIETYQNTTQFGAGISPDNHIQTNGEWVRVSLSIADLGWANWNGTDVFDPQGVLDYLKFGFTTGNVADQGFTDYEINIDEVTISDGPMF